MSQYSRIKTDKFRERSYTSYIIKKEKKKLSQYNVLILHNLAYFYHEKLAIIYYTDGKW